MTSQPWIQPTASATRSAAARLQWSHDLSAMDTPHTRPTTHHHACRFNGAMTSQPWIQVTDRSGRCTEPLLQWSHDLSAMDTVQYRKQRAAHIRLQWSHDLSAMDTTPCADNRRGYPRGFNGAMTSQPWIQLQEKSNDLPTVTCFNGAMTSQPWIPAHFTRDGSGYG